MDIELKSALDGIRDTVTSYGSRITAIQQQVDAIDIANAGRITSDGSGADPLRKAFEDSPELARMKELGGKGRATIKIATKDLISSTAVGYGVAGVLAPERVGPIVPQAQRRLFLRDLLSRGNRVTGSNAYFIQETSFTNAASPQGAEGTAKGESALTFATVDRPVVTLAHWIPASRQVLDDLPALLGYVRSKLLYGLRFKEELELLSGDGSSYHLTGLMTSAAPFNSGLLHGSWTKLDVLRRALEQVELADEVPAGFFVLSPVDWADIELTKTTFGSYVIGEPGGSDMGHSLWGRPVVVTTALTPGLFLAGSSEGAEILDRLDATVEVSSDFSDYFVRNLVALLCELREVLCIYRPNAFVTGSLVSSPA